MGLAARPFTPDWQSVGTLAGPVASLLILTGSILWLVRRERLPQQRRWVFALGLTAAARVLFVWLLAGPLLLGWRPSVTFDELRIAPWIGAPVGALLAVETVLAIGGAAWLVRAIPRAERRAAVLGIAAGVAVVGFAVMLLDPRV